VITDVLQARVRSSGDAPFIISGERAFSFAEVDERSGRAAALLREVGVRRGDKVCLMLSNRPEFVELWFGLAKLGAVMVPLDPALKGVAFSHIAAHSEAAVLAAEPSVFLSPGDPGRGLDRFRVRMCVGGSEGGPGDLVDYRKAVATLPPEGRLRAAAGPDDVMSIIYTPGTTGLPKGVMISHAHYRHSGKAWAESVVRAGAEDVFFTTLPLSRIETQTLSVMAALAAGRPLVLSGPLEAAAFMGEIRRRGVTVFDYSIPMIEDLLRLPPRREDAGGPARLACGAAMPGEFRREFERRFSVRIVERFGIIECGGAALVNAGGGDKEGSIGRPLPLYEVKVVDEFDQELPTGISGEIVLRPRIPKAIFLGYHKEPDRTAESVRGGWFHSGDRGYADEEGDFYFLDRMGDYIRCRGESISSAEIERILDSHPDVLESAAIGVPSELQEEDVKVFIVPRPGAALSPEGIVEWCAGRMGRHMVPRYVDLVGELPKTPTGVTRKQELRHWPAGSERAPEKAET
jgi:crotonobetaine/carnitine-CoA ligase